MSENGSSEYTPQEKAADIAWRLASGDEVTTNEVAEYYGVTYHGARRMLNVISRVIPITTNSTGVWRRFDIT